MIIVQLLGGLGNQMFQYASARSIALHKNTKLKLDIFFFGTYKQDTRRQYDLGCFNTLQDFATPEDIYKVKGRISDGLSGKLFKAFDMLKPISKRRYIKEKHFHFDPRIFDISTDAYLKGYWQSEKYFKGIEDTIREEFTLREDPDAENKMAAEQITSVPSVSIHIRRGDYVEDAKTNSVHGTCSLDYYHKAVDMIAGRIKDPHFFIFSDDPGWVKENLKLDYPVTYINHNLGKKDYEDMRLMSLCRHQITANSSFSWWGAWLNKNPGKIVIVPGQWFKDNSINTKDLIPAGWKRI